MVTVGEWTGRRVGPEGRHVDFAPGSPGVVTNPTKTPVWRAQNGALDCRVGIPSTHPDATIGPSLKGIKGGAVGAAASAISDLTIDAINGEWGDCVYAD